MIEQRVTLGKKKRGGKAQMNSQQGEHREYTIEMTCLGVAFTWSNCALVHGYFGLALELPVGLGARVGGATLYMYGHPNRANVWVLYGHGEVPCPVRLELCFLAS